jgi:hypothetical protein
MAIGAGLVELTGDDRAVTFGLLSEAAAELRSDGCKEQLLLWRRPGGREFDLAAH